MQRTLALREGGTNSLPLSEGEYKGVPPWRNGESKPPSIPPWASRGRELWSSRCSNDDGDDVHAVVFLMTD